MENTCGFVHLHNHTMYSLLDGAIRPKDMIDCAVEWGMGALAMTDHGNMFGAIDFYLKANKAGIKPIIGSEVYVAIEGRDVKRPARGHKNGANHLVLLAATDQGYRNLMKIVSLGFLEGFYYNPRVDKDLLREYSEGLIAMSACISGELPEHIIQGNPEKAVEAAKEYEDIFGKGNFYIELQNHGLENEIKALPGLIELSKTTGIPMVCTNDAHYLKQEHAKSHDVLLCISTGKTLNDEKRMDIDTDQIYLKSPDEMRELFGDYPEALTNTVEIAERCNVKIKTGEYFPVRFDVPRDFEGNTDDYLVHLSNIGLKERYGDDGEKHRERMEYELGIIQKMGFSDYFLAIYDCTRAAREMDIPVGTARGSAGGSIVAYAIGITNLDPMRFDLIFERFLNPERVSMPDFDVDYADRDRARMIEYVKEKYGEDHVCQIITFGTMKARSVIRDVGRVMGMDYGEVDAIAKLIPTDLKMTLDKAVNQVPELAELRNTQKELFDHAFVLEGLNRHAGTHAAGVVITPGPCTEYLPVYKPQGEDATSQYTMEYVEMIGALKVDFLGLRTLTVIKDAVDMVADKGIEIDLDALPFDDPNVYELMGNGDTVGIFQFESPGMREYLRKLKPTVIEDLIAMNALYRPGPLGANMVDTFIDRKQGREKIAYPHPLLEDILKETYGVIVYQEQVMKIASVMAGFTLGGADQLRRAMGKKKEEVMKQMKIEFLAGAEKKDIDTNIAGEVFDLMAHFAGYGFNKSHSAGYAILAYQTAWLKAHHPPEFMAANMSSEMDNTDRIVIMIDECKKMGIEVLPPDVNASFDKFTVEDGNVRFGLGGVKNVGHGGIEEIVNAREEGGPFEDIFDFFTRVDMKALNKRMVESLIQAGAMDSFGVKREQLSAVIDPAIEFVQAVLREKNSNQISLFGGPTEESSVMKLTPPPYPEGTKLSRMERLAQEKAVLGFWFSGNPLQGYEDELRAFAVPFSKLFMENDRAMVTVGGVITSVQRKTTKKDKPMMILRVEDLESAGDVLLIGKEYDDYKDIVAVDKLVLIEGSVSKNGGEDQPSVFMRSLSPLADARERARNVTISLSTAGADTPKLDSIISVCKSHPGNAFLWIKLQTATSGTFRVKTKKYRVAAEVAFIEELRSIVGRNSVFIG